ncbi:MAG: hypothetical protein R2878_00515 [Thermoleophilia bacterium]
MPRGLAYLGPWEHDLVPGHREERVRLDGPSVGVDFTNLAFFLLLPLAMAGAIRIGLNPFVATIVLNHLGPAGGTAGTHG